MCSYAKCGGSYTRGCSSSNWYDCADDGCVRNGHMLGSSWCSDEFASASDDELSAPDCYRADIGRGARTGLPFGSSVAFINCTPFK